MSRAVTRFSTSCSLSPCFISSATYSLLYSVPICGVFDFPSVVTVVTNTLLPFTIGDDHPRPWISAAHSTFSVFDHFSGNLPFATTGEVVEDGERGMRSEEHTSELQSRLHLVCRLLLEKKKKTNKDPH